MRSIPFAAAGMKNVLALRSEVTALHRVEAAWSSLEGYFALNARIERVFRESCGRFKSGPPGIITAELVAGLYPPEFKIKVTTALDVKGSWKEHPDLVHLVSREGVKVWAIVEQADKLRRVQSYANGAVARVGSTKEEITARIEYGGQGLSARSGDLKLRGSCWSCGKEGLRMADCTSRRKLGAPGVQQQVTAQTGGATSKQHRVQSHASGAVAQVGKAKEERTARLGRGGQGSSVRSGDEAAW